MILFTISESILLCGVCNYVSLVSDILYINANMTPK